MQLVLPERGVVRIAGVGVLEFLHDIFTADLKTRASGESCAAALLTPQGKIRYLLMLTVRSTDEVLCDLPARDVAPFIKHMTLYRMRRALEITAVSEAFCVETGGPNAPNDPRWEGLGPRQITTRRQTSGTEDTSAYERQRIRCGIAEIHADFAPDTVFPFDIGLDYLGGMSFSKGCYIGQEVISRMHHRHSVRRRLFCVASAEKTPLPQPFSEVRSGEHRIGVIGGALEDQGLMIARTDRLRSAIDGGAAITCEGVPLLVTPPPWAGADYGMPS